MLRDDDVRDEKGTVTVNECTKVDINSKRNEIKNEKNL
jgi:hypothetical protein